MLKLDVAKLMVVFEQNCAPQTALVGAISAGLLSEFVDLPGPMANLVKTKVSSPEGMGMIQNLLS